MKHKYLLALLITTSFFLKGYSQNCKSFGCAANYGERTVITTVTDVMGPTNSCYNLIPYKVAHWQFFYSPFGGTFTQTYTPTSTGDPLDLDYIVFDMGISGPASIECPVDPSSFTQVLCNIFATYNTPTGPGVDGTLTTTAGHFYAIVIFVWQSTDPTYKFTVGTPLMDGLPLDASNCPGALPVKLTSFDAKVNDCIVDLEWIAETESRFKNYEVEFSTDGRNFQTVATIASQGGDGSNKKYSYKHTDPQEGKIFYKLKMKDLDGSIEYSKIIALTLDCDRSAVFVYPNPVTDILNVNITNSAYDLTKANLFDNNGKLVYSGSLKSGTNTIDMRKFAKGVYLLRLKTNTEIQNIKIIK